MTKRRATELGNNNIELKMNNDRVDGHYYSFAWI